MKLSQNDRDMETKKGIITDTNSSLFLLKTESQRSPNRYLIMLKEKIHEHETLINNKLDRRKNAQVK